MADMLDRIRVCGVKPPFLHEKYHMSSISTKHFKRFLLNFSPSMHISFQAGGFLLSCDANKGILEFCKISLPAINLDFTIKYQTDSSPTQLDRNRTNQSRARKTFLFQIKVQLCFIATYGKQPDIYGMKLKLIMEALKFAEFQNMALS